ncbi:FHA domain-containing protein [Paraburkholderia caffeinilytica]|uniref:FHA domain-containing protein n=1 Tax=Paraburkholderia caffeinilytica TaxID=1761016 RepID=UPI0038BB81C4
MPSSSLRLTIIACHGKTFARGASAVFDAAGGTVGRDAGNTLVLPDDDGTVARHHAAIRALTDGWLLLNTSEHAAIALNGKILAPGAQASLDTGDIVNIGAYVLQTTASASAPSWNSLLNDGHAGEAGTFVPSLAAASSDPLQMMAGPASHPASPLNGTGPSLGLHGLLDTPLDPLALFDAPDRTGFGSIWNDPGWNESAATDLFADLAAAPAHGDFKASHRDTLPGNAIRDDMPELNGHLRLKIALPPDNRGSLEPPASRRPLEPLAPVVPELAAMTVAEASPSAESPSLHGAPTGQADYRIAVGETHHELARVMQPPAPDYSGKLHTQTALGNKRPIRLRVPLRPVTHPAPPVAPAEEPPASQSLLVRAFLEGAGALPDADDNASLTPEIMHALGALVRTLKRQVT